jgi:Short C-terminal domain
MGLLRMAARTAVVAGTATAVSGRVARRQARRYEEQAEPEPAPEAAPPEDEPAQEAPPEDDLTAKVQQLAALHTQGLLTDDEFAAAKAKALGI